MILNKCIYKCIPNLYHIELAAELGKVEEAVDNVADRMEEIAEKVEEFVGDIADDLGSQFRMTLEKVENVADIIGKDAKMVSDIVDKVKSSIYVTH